MRIGQIWGVVALFVASSACGAGDQAKPEQGEANEPFVQADAIAPQDAHGGRLTVHRRDGSAVEGAWVAIALAQDDLVWVDDDGSDASGHVQLPRIDGVESAYIHVAPPDEDGPALLDAQVHYIPGRDVVVQLDVESEIAGIVVDPDGHPIPDVPIYVEHDSEEWTSRDPTDQRSPASAMVFHRRLGLRSSGRGGEFRVGGLRAGQDVRLSAGALLLHAEERARLPLSESIVGATAGDRDVTLALPKRSTLRVTVTGGKGCFWTKAVACNDEGFYSWTVTAQQSLLFTGLTPDRPVTVLLRSLRPPRVAYCESVLPGGNIEIEASDGFVLSGRVRTPPDTWPSAARVVFRVAGTPILVRRVNNDGSFALAGLPPASGTLTVTLSRKNGGPLSASIPATPGEPVDVRLSSER